MYFHSHSYQYKYKLFLIATDDGVKKNKANKDEAGKLWTRTSLLELKLSLHSPKLLSIVFAVLHSCTNFKTKLFDDS